VLFFHYISFYSDYLVSELFCCCVDCLIIRRDKLLVKLVMHIYILIKKKKIKIKKRWDESSRQKFIWF